MHLAVAMAITGTILLAAFTIFAVRRRTSAAVSPERSELLAGQNRWQAPAELVGRPLPRPVRLTPLGKTTLVHGLLTLCTGIGPGGVLTWLALRDLGEYRMLAREGVTTNAQILQKREEQQWGVPLGKTTLRYVTFSFKAGGRTYGGQAGVPLSIFQRIRPGDSMPVRYRPSNPAHNRLLVEGEGYAAAVWLTVLALFGCALALLFAWRNLWPVLVQRRVLAWGQPVGAMVVRISPRKKGTKLAYQFLDRAGNLLQGTARVEGTRTFMLRQIITVLYEEKVPGRNTLYPAPLAWSGP
jgi:hypothetical protein